MAKLTVARLFEISQIATTKAYQEMAPFVEYVNSLADNLVRILTNGISLKDNVDCDVITQDLRHATPSNFITNTGKRPLVITLGRQSPITPAITSFVWTINDANEIVATITLSNPAYTGAISVTMVVHYS